jgi:hypothetical protein
MQRKVFLRHKTLGMIQKKSPALQAGLDHSSRLNVTLAGCSSAEVVSYEEDNFTSLASFDFSLPLDLPIERMLVELNESILMGKIHYTQGISCYTLP